MKVLIVGKTRRGSGACVGGITEDGRSVRLVAADASVNGRAGLEYGIGEVWEIDWAPDPDIIPPHVENIIVHRAHHLRHSHRLEETIRRFMPPVAGGPEGLFEGLAQATSRGGLFIAQRTGLPRQSTTFWVPDHPLQLDCEGKRIHYRYPTSDGGRSLAFVGFQDPLPEIPAGTLLRVSLAHWWHPQDRPDEELRCFVQLSGWIGATQSRNQGTSPQPQPNVCHLIPAKPSVEVAALLPRAHQVLKQTFGFSQFLPVQRDVISRVLHRQDTLAVMPTGGGKSLCYQLPAILSDGLTVVVSPLIALMQDQVRQLREVDIPAECLNHTVPIPQYRAIASGVRNGKIKILYLAPETLLRPETLLLIEQSNLTCLAVDEAHCISEWGHDFRPEYRQLHSLRRRFPQAVCLALTATATSRVRQDIRRLLDIPPEGEFLASFNRRNLLLAVEQRRDGLAQVLAFLEKHRGQSGIIYCSKRKQADELSAALAANGWPALPYHAGLDPDVRRLNQHRFIHDEVPVMVATVAFGMGINKSNVRFVVHANLPKDVESYYQEIGRAGRDGLPADCLLLYSRSDAVLHRHFIDQGAESERPGRQARLEALLRYAEARECRRVPLLAYFGEDLPAACGHCDNCVRGPLTGETIDVTADAQKFLSCIKLTGQMFGPAHIIAILRGSRSARVLERGHDRLSAYGVGKEHSTAQWRELAQQFISLGLAEQDLEFGGVRLTPKAWDVLQGKEKVSVSVEHVAVKTAAADPNTEHDAELFEVLRKVRREQADEVKLPAYMIFSDRALVEMATFFPQDDAQFLAINGVGEAKLAKYGELFLQAIRSYCASRGLAAKSSQAATTSAEIIRPVSRRRSDEVGELFGEGKSLEEIASRFNVMEETVIQQLYRFHQSGGRLDPQRLLGFSRLSDSEHDLVLNAFESLGCERLAPVREALLGAVSYGELHLLRLYWLCQARAKPE